MKTEISYHDIFTAVATKISELFADQNIDYLQARYMLFCYGEAEGEDAVRAFYGLMKYVETHSEDLRFTKPGIQATFAHDLNGAGSIGFLPRSSGYLKYCP